MNFEKFMVQNTMNTRNLYYKLNLIFGLFFLFPVLGFIAFAVKYQILADRFIPFFFLGLLGFSFVGFTMLRRYCDNINRVSRSMIDRIGEDLPGGAPPLNSDELQTIVQSFNAIENRFKETFQKLEKKASDISILKELSELCYVTFDPEEILYVTLERALLLTRSDIGSVLILERPRRDSFIVKACIGHGGAIKIGDRIDFETSIAKYAVINKSPLVVENIEKDRRFGRSNLLHYGTKSFICMPIKTSKEIVGVLTISRKKEDITYSLEDTEALTPLLGNAAFTYENLRLITENDQRQMYLKYIDKIFKIVNSSFRESEMVDAILDEFQGVVAFDFAMVLVVEENRPDSVKLFELMAAGSINLVTGSSFPCKGTVLEKAMKQDTMLIVADTDKLHDSTERELFSNKGCKSAAIVPLKIDGKVNGVLALLGREDETFLKAQNFIEWVAGATALAIERNKLSAGISKRNRELDSIRQIGRALASSTFDIGQVLKYTMEMIRTIMNVEAGSLLMVEDDELSFAVAFNIKSELLKDFRMKLGQGLAGYAAARGEAIIVNDVQSSQQFFPDVDRYTGFKTRSALCVPMISQGKVMGVLEVLNKIHGEFGHDDEDLLQSIASSVSIAIENARLYKETVSMAKQERDIRRMFQKFVPKEIVEKIIYGSETGKSVVEEVKTLTLLNIDIRGFSKIAREFGPQKTVFLLNTFFSAMGGIVFKHQGIVDKYLGDGFLALFGAPVSSTADADNAIAAALEMKASVAAVNASLQKDIGVTVDIGISVHTGEVVVGNIGFERKMDYTVIGDSVNTVFRLQELTRLMPNIILISGNTCNIARSHPKLRRLEERDSSRGRGLENLPVFELLAVQNGESIP
jgi:class 3 adenylate cyclase/putative methionine-R-sulfoxide reductase with GAF domain